MLRFSHSIAIGVVASSLLFACGDKINPQGDYVPPTGGSTAGTTGEGGSGGGGSTGSGNVTYTNDIKALLDKHCNSCHSSSGAASPPLDSYNAAKTNAQHSNADIQGTGAMPMPPAGGMSPAEKKLFQDWVTQGTPQ